MNIASWSMLAGFPLPARASRLTLVNRKRKVRFRRSTSSDWSGQMESFESIKDETGPGKVCRGWQGNLPTLGAAAIA